MKSLASTGFAGCLLLPVIVHQLVNVEAALLRQLLTVAMNFGDDFVLQTARHPAVV